MKRKLSEHLINPLWLAIYYGAMTIIVIWTAVGLNYLYSQYWPIQIIEHHFTEAKVLNPGHKVRKGDYLEFQYEYSKHREMGGIVSRMLVNDRIVPLTIGECAVLPMGLNQKKKIRVYIPENMFAAKYYLVTSIRYPITDNRTETVTYRTEWFEVTE